jgi:nitrogen fixation protein NifZ
MIPPREPVFQWGQRVRCNLDLLNDGSHPGFAQDGVIVTAQTEGEIVNVGHHAESNTPVYLVEFEGARVVGCLEEELVAS